MIYILEGPDGVGKTTLAQAIAEETKGHILHCSFNKDWDIREYHLHIIYVANLLNRHQDVVIDRWAPSEFVYGSVFRGEPAYDVFDFLSEKEESLKNVKWIMCKNKNAVLNHFKNKSERKEMFEDMTDVVANFHLFENDTPELNWIDYDFEEQGKDLKKFVKELIK